MKKYDVSTSDDKGYPLKQVEIQAPSPSEAYKIFVDSNKPLPFKSIFVNWGLLGAKRFEPPHYEGHENLNDPEKQKEILEAEQRREALEKETLLNNLTEKISSNGFSELSAEEISIIADVVDEVFLSDQLSEDELKLTQATLADEKAYRFFSLRSNSRTSLQQKAMLEAMNVNLSNISKKTGGIKMASMFTGMAAARHMGEEIAEDMGGGDDSGGGWEE